MQAPNNNYAPYDASVYEAQFGGDSGHHDQIPLNSLSHSEPRHDELSHEPIQDFGHGFDSVQDHDSKFENSAPAFDFGYDNELQHDHNDAGFGHTHGAEPAHPHGDYSDSQANQEGLRHFNHDS